MGLWMIQEIRSEQEVSHTYREICELASDNATFPGIINVNDQQFLAPKSMTQAVIDHLRKSGSMEPTCLGELYYCVYHSLAVEYANSLNQLETLTNRTFHAINIVGGGSQNRLLNELTATLTGKKVITGPTEATALGNVVVQMLATGEIKDPHEIHALIEQTIHFEIYKS